MARSATRIMQKITLSSLNSEGTPVKRKKNMSGFYPVEHWKNGFRKGENQE